METPVILLHGLWMHPLTMRRLGKRLVAGGYQPHAVGYRSLREDAAGARARVALALGRLPGAHVVAHSLGGLMALEALRADPRLQAGRVVCLGTPLQGSSSARRLARNGLVRRCLGRSAGLLCEGVAELPPGVEVGAVAGARPLGMGALLSRLSGPHDGTVAVAETRLPGLAGHVVVDASHTGLLVSAEAARQVLGFLATGRFPQA